MKELKGNATKGVIISKKVTSALMKEKLTESEREEYRRAYEGSYLPNWQYSHLEQSEQAAWDEVERLTAESDIKSDAIKKYENDAEYWYQETEKARSMFLCAHDEKVSLRKALEEARKEVNKGGTHPEVMRRMFKIIDAALGEGERP